MKNNLQFLLTFFIFFDAVALYASNYDEDVLTIYAKIIPRFVLMSSQKEKLINTINICIVSDTVDEIFVEQLIKKINTIYPHGLKNYAIHFTKAHYKNVELCKTTQLLFLFNTHSLNINYLTQFSKRHNILTIAYDYQLLREDIDISLFLGRKIVPYINIQSVTDKNITFNNMLLRISKIYKKEDDL